MRLLGDRHNEWDLFDHDGTGILELQRDDESDYFASDEEAWQHVMNLARMGDLYAISDLLELLNNWRPYMLKVMRGEKL